jgi:hypothetical protein
MTLAVRKMVKYSPANAHRLGEAAAKMLEVIKPVAAEATNDEIFSRPRKTQIVSPTKTRTHACARPVQTFGQHLST